MRYTHLEVETHGPTLLARINRPEALNAINLALEDDLRAFFGAVAADDAVRAVVLTGTGRAFSAGVDLKELSEGEGMSARTWHGRQSVAGAIASCGKPVIGAINGYAVTGGLELALQTDFMIASEAAKFADTHARVGITPSWGMTQILPRLIGAARARRMSLTGAFIDAETALAWGLVTEVTTAEALIPRALEIAAEIAETDPVAMGRIRDLIREGQDLPLSAALARECELFDAHMAGVSPADIAESRKAVQARGRRVAGGGAK